MFTHQTIQPNKNLPFRLLLHGSPQHHVIRHWHRSLEVSYTISGTIDDYYIDGKHYTTGPGDILIVNSHSIHGADVDYQENRLSLSLLFPKEFIKPLIREIDSYRFVHPMEACHTRAKMEAYIELQQCFKKLSTCALREMDDVNNLEILSHTYHILHVLLNEFTVKADELPAFIAHKQFGYLNTITTFIEENYKEELSLSYIATCVHLSEGHLTRLFKKYMGITIHQYIHSVRLQHAYRLLLNSDANLEEIAFESGFPNKKSFIQQFKATYQLTPHQYRLMRRKEGREG